MSSRPKERPWDARERERREQAEFEAKLQKAREERQKKLQAKRKKERDSQSHLQRAAAKDGFDSLKSYIRRAKVRSIRDLVKVPLPPISTPSSDEATRDCTFVDPPPPNT